VRARCGLTQAAFAEKIEVPIETVRNWEQGKRHPRGPARALAQIDRSGARRCFATLGGRRR
jgi:putative transcriptional regulator